MSAHEHAERTWRAHRDAANSPVNVRRSSFMAGYEAGQSYEKFLANFEIVLRALEDKSELGADFRAENRDRLKRLAELLGV